MKAVGFVPVPYPPGVVAENNGMTPAEGVSAAIFVNDPRPRRLPTAFGWVVLLGALVNVAVVMLLFVYWLTH